MDIVVKIENSKITISINEQPVCVALEEADADFISKVHGTFMFGINGAKVEFADFRVSAIIPPKGEELPRVEEESAPEDSDDSGTEETEAVEIDTEAPVDASNVCKSKTMCSDRSSWCSEMYKDETPTDCVDKFEDYCCGELATQNIMQCKQDVANALAPIEADPTVTQSCYDQSAITGDKLK